MKKFTIRISQKIIGGFLILIVIFSINAGLSILTLNQSASIIRESSDVINPSRESLNEMNLLVTKSKMYITNWVYLQSNKEDKDALKRLHETEYPELKKKLVSLKTQWKEKEQAAKMDTIFSAFDALLKIEEGIMTKLVTFESYEDPEIKFDAINTIDTDVLPTSALLIKKINEVLARKREETQKAEANLVYSFNNLRIITIGVGLSLILIGMIAAFFISRSIIRPIDFIKKIIQQLGRGELPQDRKQNFSQDEVGEMAKAVDKLVVGLRSTSLFAESIGKGHYDAEFVPLSDQDVLGNSLIEMRNNLQKVAEDDKKRNWATEGMALFGEILRKNNDNIARLSDEIISNLVKYLGANQGGLFIVNDEDIEERHLYLSACYAWDKKKYIEQKIYIGDGLTGQAWQEKDAIYLTEVPDHYISITSGLGEANPKSILIVPLKINNEVFGVMEIASFSEFHPHEREFVERIAESIASTISTVKINERTQKLLDESTQMTEEMRAQEEEMRQNMEELQATQEEMQRSQRDTQARETVFYNTQCIIETDAQLIISHVSAPLLKRLKYHQEDLLGNAIDKFFENSAAFKQLKKSVTEQDSWSGVLNLKGKQGEKVAFKMTVAGVEDNYHNVNKFLLLLTDLTEVPITPPAV
jgi:putative methionine-R-sulfoxide reductase with GAF domain/HAMP domain-containing protein